MELEKRLCKSGISRHLTQRGSSEERTTFRCRVSRQRCEANDRCLGLMDMARGPCHPTLREAALYMLRSKTTAFFPLNRGGFKPELFNY